MDAKLAGNAGEARTALSANVAQAPRYFSRAALFWVRQPPLQTPHFCVAARTKPVLNALYRRRSERRSRNSRSN
eukprot:2575824-Pleurochrysis_carterae.AAC.7